MELEHWKSENLAVDESGEVHTFTTKWGVRYPADVCMDTFDKCWADARKDPEARALYYKNLLYNQSALHRRVLELEEKLGVGPEDWKKFNEEIRQ